MPDEIVRRGLRSARYRFLHSRKKGLFKKNDLEKRCKFVCKVTQLFLHEFTKMQTDKFWEEGLSFYFDDSGF